MEKLQLISLFLFLQHAAVMELVWLPVTAVRVASVFAFPTMGAMSVMNVHQASMDIQTVLVSGFGPSMSTNTTTMQIRYLCL